MFHIGQEVEFVGTPGQWRWWSNANPIPHNTVFTVKEIRCLPTDLPNEPHLLLREHCCGYNSLTGIELATPARFFRPVQKKKDEKYWTQGAPKDSEKFDNRHKIKEKT